MALTLCTLLLTQGILRPCLKNHPMITPRKFDVGPHVLAYHVPIAAMAHMREAFPDLCQKLGLKKVRDRPFDRAGLGY